MKTGFIVNPIAGMGGRVGLKGTDNKVDEALKLGAEPVSAGRAKEFLKFVDKNIEFLTCPAEMGADFLNGFKFKLISNEKFGQGNGILLTTSAHTKKFARAMLEKVDLIVFVGGDGTAQDIYEVCKDKIPILGVPAGVKIYSSVFGSTPKKSAELLNKFVEGRIKTELREIIDIDEAAISKDEFKTKLVGFAKVPYEAELVQGAKLTFEGDVEVAQDAIAESFKEDAKDGLYLFGAGTTVSRIMQELGLEGTLLGVDIVEIKNSAAKMLKKDANEKDILSALENWKGLKRIVVSPLGGQGFIFGRGIQQISEKVLAEFKKDEIIIVATLDKLKEINLKLDMPTAITEKFNGYARVLTGYNEYKMAKIE